MLFSKMVLNIEIMLTTNTFNTKFLNLLKDIVDAESTKLVSTISNLNGVF